MSNADCTLSQSYLKEILRYDETTGVFSWVKHKPQQRKDIPPGFVNKDGYHIIKINHKAYKAHRLAWLYVHGEFPSIFVDHINRNRSDNRIANLRLATMSENLHNIEKSKNNTTGYLGVSYSKTAKKYVANLTVNRVPYFLGYFDSAKEASIAYNKRKSEMTKFYQPKEKA